MSVVKRFRQWLRRVSQAQAKKFRKVAAARGASEMTEAVSPRLKDARRQLARAIVAYGINTHLPLRMQAHGITWDSLHEDIGRAYLAAVEAEKDDDTQQGKTE
jgi:hypothetical protein